MTWKLSEEHVYYIVEGLMVSSPSFVAPIYVIFLLSKGLDYRGVAFVDGCYMVTVLLLGFFTGAFADRYGRKKACILGGISLALGLLAYSQSQCLLHFLFSEFLAGVGIAFYSGSMEAWIYDELKRRGRMEEASKIFGYGGGVSQGISILAAFLGGIVAELSMSIPFFLGFLMAFITSVIALFIMWENFGEEKLNRKIWLQLKAGFKAVKQDRMLIYLMLAIMLLALANPTFNLTWAPRLEELGGSKWFLGLTSSIFMATVGLSQIIGGKISEKIGPKTTMIMGCFLGLISFLCLSQASNPLLFLILALPFEVGLGLRFPAFKDWFNKIIPSQERATIIGFRGIIIRVAAILGMITMGFLCDFMGILSAYTWAAIIYLNSLLVLLIFTRNPNIG